MSIKTRFLIWLLEHHPGRYLRLKRLENGDIGGDRDFLALHAELLRDDRCVQTLEERYSLYSLTRATAKLPGALAEAGVYRGGSAKIICRAKGDAAFYLFDTFAGLPAVDREVDGNFSTGDFGDTGLADVRSYLAGFPNLHFYPGLFPDSASGLEPERQTFRFVHLDLDLHRSTLDALHFFYPRMVKGGVILSHDYRSVHAPGVRAAFDEFLVDKMETPLCLPGSHGGFVKS